MEVPVEGMPDNVTLLSALAVLKILDADGDICYIVRATDQLMSVEAMGMAQFALMQLMREEA